MKKDPNNILRKKQKARERIQRYEQGYYDGRFSTKVVCSKRKDKYKNYDLVDLD